MKNIDGWVVVEDGAWTFQVPQAHIRTQGRLQAILVPVLVLFLWGLFSALGYQDGWLVPVFWGAVFGPVALLGLILGLRKAARSQQISEESRHVLDIGAGTLDGVAVSPTAVQIRQPNRLVKFLALELATEQGPRPLLIRLNVQQGPASVKLGEEVAEALGVAFVDDAGARTGDVFGIATRPRRCSA